MIIENTPQFIPSGKGLGASFAVNFSTDLQHQIRTDGTWQGDPKKGMSLYIDNYNNNYDISIVGTNVTTRCPAYSYGYVDISQTDFITLTSPVGGTINITVDTGVYPYGFTARGNAPDSVGDNFAAAVAGLYHFNGQNGSLIAVDDSIGGLGNITLVTTSSQISTVDKKFGVSAMRMRQTAMVTSGSSGTYAFGTALTIEFWIKVMVNGVNTRTITSLGALGVDIAVSPSGTNVLLQGLGMAQLLGTTTAPVWKHVAFVKSDTQNQLYINGVMVNSSVSAALIAGNYALTFGDVDSPDAYDFYIDELRITNDARYLVDFTPPIQEFSL